MTIQCAIHNRDLYEDVRDGIPMGRWLCPEQDCATIMAASMLAAVRDMSWCEANGMTAPGWEPAGIVIGAAGPGEITVTGCTSRPEGLTP